MAHLPERPMRSMVAAAANLSGRRIVRSAPERWQQEAWDLFDAVGELQYVANVRASAMSRAKLFVARMPEGADEPEPVTSGPAVDLFHRFGGGMLGQAELIRRLSLQLTVPGDGWMVGLPPGTLDVSSPSDLPPAPSIVPGGEWSVDDLEWHCLSVEEFRVQQDKAILDLGGGNRRELPEDQVMPVRVWRPHPRRWWQAVSPVKANLPVLRELVGLTKHVSASIDSRLAGAGLLILPDGVKVLGFDLSAEDLAAGVDPFMAALQEAMLTPIQDRDAASAVVPISITVPPDVVDKVQHLTFDTPFDREAVKLREEAIRRFALGMDAPPEQLLGMSSANHWTGWQVEEAEIKAHIEPALALLCDAWTVGVLRPALEVDRVADAAEWIVWFDTHDLTLRPNRTAEATDGFDRRLLNGEAWRREAGFDENDAPEEQDPAVALVVEMLRGSPTLAREVGVGVLLEQVRAMLEGRPVPEGEGPSSNGDRGLPDTRGDVPPPDDGAPEQMAVRIQNLRARHRG